MYADIGYIPSNLDEILRSVDPFVTDESFSKWLNALVEEIDGFNTPSIVNINGHSYKIRLLPATVAHLRQLGCGIDIDGGEDLRELDLKTKKVQDTILGVCKDLIKALNEHLAKTSVAYIATTPCLWFEGSYYVKLESVHSKVNTEFVLIKFNENLDESMLYLDMLPDSTL